MLRTAMTKIVTLVLVLGLVGVLIADEGTVESLKKGTLAVKIDGKVESFKLKGVKVVNKDGEKLKGKDRRKLLKKGAKVDVKKEGDKVVQIKVLD